MFARIWAVLADLTIDEEAATLTEYGIVAALFSAAAVVALATIAATAGGVYNSGTAGIENYQTSSPP